MLNFRKRQTTEQVCIVPRPTKGLPLEKLFRQARMQGELDTGFHIIIHADGEMEYDRDIEAVAEYGYPDYETSIYVLADAKDVKHISDAQKAAISKLEETYKYPIKYIEV